MKLAYFKFRYELNEPTAGTAEETEAASLQRRRAAAKTGAHPAAPRHRVGYPQVRGTQAPEYVAICQLPTGMLAGLDRLYSHLILKSSDKYKF
jgi:hypothetical protein